MQAKSRKFRGFAAIERPAGALVWGTLRPSREEAAAIYAKWNPAPEGSERPAQIVAVEIYLQIPGEIR